jgi:hypothetical protein
MQRDYRQAAREYIANGEAGADPDPFDPELRPAPKAPEKKRKGDRKPKGPALTQGEILLQLAEGQEYFLGQDGAVYAAVQASAPPRRETVPVRGKDFRSWLAGRYYTQTRKAPSAGLLQDAVGVLEARGRFEGGRRDVFTRVGRRGVDLYLDLCDDAWRAARIGPGGWEVLARPPVHFRRPRGLAPLPAPVRGGSLDALRPYLNVGELEWPLVVAWLAQALYLPGPYPHLCLFGEQGSAKSTTARVLRSLIDPSIAALRSEPRDERDLILSASNSWVVALDNLSGLTGWLSDALCRLSTGGGFATRELYSDADEVIFDVMRPAVLTGIEDLATRDDLLDRCVVLQLPTIDDDGRQTEREFWRAFEADRPGILGALLDALAGALSKLPGVKLSRPPRMADFAELGTALGLALGWGELEFLNAYEDNRATASSGALDASLIYDPVSKLLRQEGGRWEGKCLTLLGELAKVADDKSVRQKAWPKTPRGLSGQLRRLAPALRKNRIEVAFATDGRGAARQRLVRLRDAGLRPPGGDGGDG